MATKLLIAMHNSVLVVESSNTSWKSYEYLKGNHMPQCIAFDPSNSNRAYCGTFGGGLWKTDDSGNSWDNIGNQFISSKDIMSVSVSNLQKGDKEFNTVYVGTEPSAIYISDNGGEFWEKMSTLNKDRQRAVRTSTC